MTILFFIILVFLILKPDIVSTQVMLSCQLWISTLVPAMYPSFICIDMIANSSFVIKLSRLLFPIFKRIFNINSEASCFIILISILCGAPASTKLIANYTTDNKISENEANNLICSFSCLSLPFIVLTLKNLKIILSFYIIQIIVSIIFMKLHNEPEKQIAFTYEYKRYLDVFNSSIKKNIDILLNILGIIIFFRVILSLFLGNDFILYSYIEILGGLSKLNITSDIKIILSSLGFLGLSVHFQILAVFPKLKYLKFITARLLFALTGLLLAFLI